MQQRRRDLGPPTVDPLGRPIEASDEKWDLLCKRDMAALSNFTLIPIAPASGSLCIPFLGRDILMDIKRRCLMQKIGIRLATNIPVVVGGSDP